MDKKLMYDFEYMWKDIPINRIRIYNDDSVIVDRYVNELNDDAFAFRSNITLADVKIFMEDFVFEECRVDCDKILESMGLPVYDVFEIAKITSGFMWDSRFWLRFADNKDVTWEDLAVKFGSYGDPNEYIEYD